MNNIDKHIDKQIQPHKGYNFFGNKNRSLKFSKMIVGAIRKPELIGENRDTILGITVQKVVHEFYRIYQYYHFDTNALSGLKSIYLDLYRLIKDNKKSLSHIEKLHTVRIKEWIRFHYPSAEKIFDSCPEYLLPVPCHEYSASLQLRILNIKQNAVKGPVLDIGCGEHGLLVCSLREAGIEAFGIDRSAAHSPFLFPKDWLDFDYGDKKWGTLISHLGFSNHFRHHHLHKEGNFTQYAQCYLRILHSLRPGGEFCYAPALPFIEQYLHSDRYRCLYSPIPNMDFRAVRILKLG